VSPDVPASIRARLLALSKKTHEEFQLYLVRFAAERFLYRLGRSPHRERCILKGAGLLTLWMRDPYRPTRDVDLLASGANDVASVRDLLSEICAVECPEDGLVYDLATLDVAPIRAVEEYGGQRARLTARLGGTRIRFQVDLGFGDAVSPDPEDAEYPTLLDDLPAPRIRAYRRELSIAEKLEAMVTMGRANSRMKDFHDVWALSSQFTFDGPTLREAVRACFERRRTGLEELPDVMRPAFYEDARLAGFWSGYLRSATFTVPPPSDFTAVGERIREFLLPVLESLMQGTDFDLGWAVGGPWSFGRNRA